MMSRLPSLRAVAIFVAAGRALSFTEAAKAVNLTPSAVSRRIRDLERESDAIRPRRRGAALRLSVLQSFASLWLLPRLAAFKSVRPDIDVQVETSTELVDLVDERFDAAIRFGTGRWPGTKKLKNTNKINQTKIKKTKQSRKKEKTQTN